MPWKYRCKNCGSQMQPEKRLEDDKCRICGETLEPRYICENCGHLMFPGRDSKSFRCPECGEPVSEETVESASYERITMEGGELTVEVEGGQTTTFEAVEEVSLNFLGFEFGRIRNPDYAEFSTIRDYERTEDGVDLHFQPEEKEELLKSIQKLRNLKSNEN